YLRMVRFAAKRSEQQLLAGGPVTAACRFDRYKHGINLFEQLWIFDLELPPTCSGIVHIQNANTDRVFVSLVGCTSAPGLKCCVSDAWLLVEIKGVKNQLLALGVENAPERFFILSAYIDVEYVGNQQVTRAHQVADVAIRCQEPLLLVNLALEFCNFFVFDFGFQLKRNP